MARVKLTREERSALFAGRYPTLHREEQPEFKKGDVYVLSWSRASRYSDDEGRVFSPPPQPLFWIRVTAIARKEDRWTVRYDVVDRRDRTHWIRRTPPAYAVEADQPDPDQDEQKRSREASAYTSTRRDAVDTYSAVPTDVVDEMTLTVRKKEVEQYDRKREKVQKALAELKADPAVQERTSVIHYVERKLDELDRKVRRVA